jgi:hypothetical protein
MDELGENEQNPKFKGEFRLNSCPKSSRVQVWKKLVERRFEYSSMNIDVMLPCKLREKFQN